MILGGLQIVLFTKRTLHRSSNALLERGWKANGTKILCECVVFPFV